MDWIRLHKKKSIQLVILLIAAILIGCSYFDYAIDTRMETEASLKSEASKNNRLQSKIFEEKISYVTQTLHSFSSIAAEFDQLNDKRLLKLLDENEDVKNFIHMSISNNKGDIYTAEGNVYKAQYTANFKEVTNGQAIAFHVVNSPSNGKETIILSTPIQKEGKTIGALHTSFYTDDVKSLLNQNDTVSELSSSILQINGTMITQNETWEGDNYFTYLTKHKVPKKELEEVKSAFKNSKETSIELHVGGEREELYLTPIKDTNLVMVTELSETIIDSKLNETMGDTSKLAFQILAAVLLIVFYFVISQRRANQKIRAMNTELDMILGSLPGCMLRFPLRNPKEIEFINDEFYSLCGYNREEFKTLFQNDFRKIILEEDQIILNKSLQDDCEIDYRYIYSYRIMHKDGSIVWLYEHRQLSQGLNREIWCYSTLVNITQLKMTQQKLKVSEDRYQMIIEQTESVVFNWNMLDDTITFSPLWETKYGYQLEYKDFFNILPKLEGIDPLILVLEKMIRGQRKGSCEYHMPLADKTYNWCKIVAQSVFDDDGYLLSIFGSIEDIDDMKEKTLELEEKSKRDGMTKVLNKVTIEALIKQTIINEPEKRHLLIVFDIDNFKDINDTYGHIFGDRVLMEISSKLRTSFRQNDRIGRVGGDEFVVFMSCLDMYSNDFINQKLEYLACAIRELRFEEHPDFQVTCSIGASMYPIHGKSFAQLFDIADKALYRTKRRDKNGYCFYEESEDNQED